MEVVQDTSYWQLLWSAQEESTCGNTQSVFSGKMHLLLNLQKLQSRDSGSSTQKQKRLSDQSCYSKLKQKPHNGPFPKKGSFCSTATIRKDVRIHSSIVPNINKCNNHLNWEKFKCTLNTVQQHLLKKVSSPNSQLSVRISSASLTDSPFPVSLSYLFLC